MATFPSSSRSIRLQLVYPHTQTTSIARAMLSTSRPGGDSCGHWRVRNRICSRAIPGAMTLWKHRMLRSSLASRRLRPRNFASSMCQHFRQLCYGNYTISVLPPMQSLCTKRICTRRSGQSSGHFASWRVDKHIATNAKGADLASIHLSASLDSRSIYIRDV